MPFSADNQIQVNFRVDPRYIESSPFVENPSDLEIAKVEVILTNTSSGTNVTFELQPSQDRVSGISLWVGSRNLLKDTTYESVVRATNPQGALVSVDTTTFETNDPDTYDNIDIIVVDSVTGEPITGAVMTIDESMVTLAAPAVSRASTANGIVWIQRLLRGSYTLKMEASGYTTKTLTASEFNTTAPAFQPGSSNTFPLVAI